MSDRLKCLDCDNIIVFDVPYLDVTRTVYGKDNEILDEYSVSYSPIQTSTIKTACGLCHSTHLNIYKEN